MLEELACSDHLKIIVTHYGPYFLIQLIPRVNKCPIINAKIRQVRNI